MMQSLFLLLGAAFALSGVALGAFGAHGLKAMVSPEMLDVYKTGVTYQMWHALGLILIALIQQQSPPAKLLNWAGWLMVAGIVLFSGSLYWLVLLNMKGLGMITPFGGLGFLGAWLCLALFAVKKPSY